MNDQSEITLFALCESLKHLGFKHQVLDSTEWWKDKNKRIEAVKNNYYYVLIFDIEFCKFIWGTEFGNSDGLQNWLYNLKRMSMCEDRLWYLEVEFLKKTQFNRGAHQ